MQFNKQSKSFILALSMLTLAACSSSDNEDSMSNETNQGSSSSEVVIPSTPTGGQDNVMSEEEIRNNELRQSQTIYFNFDDTAIKSQFDEMLGAHAAYLRANENVNVVIEGHADERGTPEYNIALGERRAVAVAKYLEALGVPSAQIAVVSYGEEKPLKLGHTDSDYKLNRRAVLVY